MQTVIQLGVLMKKVVVLSLAGVMTACASPMWQHPTNNEYAFNRDKAACSMEAERANPSTAVPYNPRLDPFQQANANIYNGTANMGRAFGVQNYFTNCMTAKGYYQVQR
jgi:hypothetical protein